MEKLKEEWALKSGEKAADGTVVKKCQVCEREFAVPSDMAEKVMLLCESQECGTTYEKQAADQVKALMKPVTDAAETIKTALGN